MKTHELSGGVRVIIAMMHIPQSTAIEPPNFFLKLGRTFTCTFREQPAVSAEHWSTRSRPSRGSLSHNETRVSRHWKRCHDALPDHHVHKFRALNNQWHNQASAAALLIWETLAHLHPRPRLEKRLPPSSQSSSLSCR